MTTATDYGAGTYAGSERDWGRAPTWRRRTDHVLRPARRLARALGWFGIGLGVAELVAPGRVSRLIGMTNRTGSRTLLRLYGLREISIGVGILSRPSSAGWLGSRVAGDLLDFAALGAALVRRGTNRKRVLGTAAALLGAAALDLYGTRRLRRVSAGRRRGKRRNGVEVHKAIRVNRSPEEVYRFWRDLINLPRFMSHLRMVEIIDHRRSHWVARGPGGTLVEWDAEIVEDVPNRRIAWRSLQTAEVSHAGSVVFTAAPGGNETEIRVDLEYRPPAGKTGRAVAMLLGEEPGQQIRTDLRAFKRAMETPAPSS